ncbi:MAG: divalent-cation tolerance protein CutA [Anaerolineae bacterium]|jgi:periplasmic divalent cation tolerance protein|nr:divalent-cation tolerance protein CutA [Anaerolineae bacterium]
MKPMVAFVTAASTDEATRIAQALVEERLAACVNIVAPIASVYRWEGRVQQDAEVLLLIKTTDARLPDLIQRVKALHSYQVPEVIALPIADGSPDYLRWLVDETR